MKNSLKKISIIAGMCAAIMMCLGALYAEQSPVGVWQTIHDDGKTVKSHVKITEDNGKLSCVVLKLFDKPEDFACTKCEGPHKDQKVIGMTIMWDMEKTGKIDKNFGDEYAGGTILDPENGKTYRCKIWRKGNVLTVRGYVAFFYRTQKWLFLK
jgi:uncharacterized protein (DUF2147 family)